MLTNNPNSLHTLEPCAEDMQLLIQKTSDLLVNYFSNISNEPASNITNPEFHLAAIGQPISEKGIKLEEALSLIDQHIVRCSVNTAGGTYQAYIPGGGVFAAAVGEFIAAATNRYVGVWGVAPAAVEIETSVIRWLCNEVGYKEKAKGILTSGGSLANFSAIVTARETLLPKNFLSGIIYTSDQVHASVYKAARLTGFSYDNIRAIETDEEFRIKPKALLEAIEKDKKQGLIPFLIVGSAGTTNTGAVDPISELADIAKANKMWLHIDAAYGGFFILTERGRKLFEGIEKADSITLDPHKGLFLPYGTGCLLVSDGARLKQAHQVGADYLQDLTFSEDRINFNDYSPELTRSFRGLRVWLPLKLYGIESFRKYLDEKLDLALWACKELKKIPGIEIIAKPQLSVIAFRYKSKKLNETNKKFLENILATQKTFISSTTINNELILRIAILCFRTHLREVQATIDAIKIAVDQLIENPI
ncbi:MAG: aminotransferase class V-fold PLP-dependent enzyme [Acidobacteria bacterium]|nr:aminotransferase class V-fold PLP-dependent enzyme [Acidobacteriota bacterium]